MEVLISKALRDWDICHDEYVFINNVSVKKINNVKLVGY